MRRPHLGSRRYSDLLVLAVAAAGVALSFGAGGERANAQGAAPSPPPVTVSRPLVRETVEWDEYTGQFAAIEFVELRARVSGYLQSINFQDGQLVKQGDLLFVIDPRPYEAVLAAGRAQLSQGQAQVELATRQLDRST